MLSFRLHVLFGIFLIMLFGCSVAFSQTDLENFKTQRRSPVRVREGQGVVLLCGPPPHSGGKLFFFFFNSDGFFMWQTFKDYRFIPDLPSVIVLLLRFFFVFYCWSLWRDSLLCNPFQRISQKNFMRVGRKMEIRIWKLYTSNAIKVKLFS